MFKRVLLSVCMVVGFTPLAAQIDARLKTDTDLLDVYKTTSGKPEVMTIFDFSGSMHGMYWHKDYYVDLAGTKHLITAANGKGWRNSLPNGDAGSNGIVPVIDTSGKIRMTYGTGANESPDWEDINYMQNTGTGRLVKPDGTLVPLSGTYNQASLTSLVKQASHIRMTAVHNSVTRTIDLPIPWAILTSVGGPAPTILTIPDTIGGGPAITPDEAYLSNNPNNVINDKVGSYYKIGLFRYNEDYLWWVFFGKDVKNADNQGSTATGNYIVPAVTTPTAAVPWTNGLPGMTRFQALKYAVIATWLKNQKKVWWGFRYLDGSESKSLNVSPDNGSASSTAISRDIRLFRPVTSAMTADPKVKQFVEAIPSGSTPLTYAFANGYSQLSLNKDASSTFGTSSGLGQSGTEKPIPPCRTSFMVVFTDGIANDEVSSNTSAIGTGSDVYGQGNAATGNTALGSLSTALKPGTANRFNIWTLASVAAHYPAGAYVSPTGTGAIAVGTAAPFLISDRGATTSNKRRVRTMTVGMSLFGNYSDAAGGKAAMYKAALYGNPKNTTWVNPTSATPTLPFDPLIPGRDDREVNPFFFDAQSVDQLTAAMEAIIDEAIVASGSVSAPSAPLVGLSLGREAFLGLFEPAKKGPLWKGDLLAAGLKLTTTSDTFLGHGDGFPNITKPVTSVTSENAIWSAADLLQSEGYSYNFEAIQYTDPLLIVGTGPRSWKKGYRKVITNVAGNTILDLDETTIPAAATVGAASDAERIAILRFLRGAHASAETGTVGSAPSIARGTIMGDIISSSPAVLEYPLSLAASSPVLSAVNTTDWKEMHFRVIFVSDNQGYIHAFGELGGVKYIADPGPPAATIKAPIAAVDELWAFYPGELLAALPKILRDSSKTHIYGVDGAPVVYFNDVPPANHVVGNRVVDGVDEARLIVGMGKGGRTYYAFDVKDPFDPKISWKLNSDTSANPVVKRMGLATSTPTLARVEVGGTTKDVVFIGGGLSTKSVDLAMGTPLGRNLVAINVLTGDVEKTWDFSSIANMGSITAPVVPVEFLPNSGRAQRVYFADQPIEGASLGTGARGSGIWALGRTTLGSNLVSRLDSSDLNDWTGGPYAATAPGLRKIYQGAAGLVISSSPVPFRLGYAYPVPRTITPAKDTSPAVMGLVFNSGDRNDPLDRDLINPVAQNQLTLLFDRQDSSSLAGNTPSPASGAGLDLNGFTDADLTDLTSIASTTATKLDPTNAAYYLKSSFGYKLLLGASSAKASADAGGPNYFPKGANAPAAVDGVLFFSDFSPGKVTDPLIPTELAQCSGTGQTKIFRMCSLLAPVFNSGTSNANLAAFDATASNCSGLAVSFANIPGPLTGLGSVGVLVSGQGRTSDGSTGSISTAGAEAEVIKGKTQNFGLRLKTWRIIR